MAWTRLGQGREAGTGVEALMAKRPPLLPFLGRPYPPLRRSGSELEGWQNRDPRPSTKGRISWGGPIEAGRSSLLDEISFEFDHGTDDVGDELATRRGRMDAHAEATGADPLPLQFSVVVAYESVAARFSRLLRSTR